MADKLSLSLVDRLNPVLVRELHQGVRNRILKILCALALATIVVIAMVVATLSDERPGWAFIVGLGALAPALMFIVPMRAQMAIAKEVQGGLSEQILLTHLHPRHVVAGHLQGSCMYMMLLVSVFAPLLAITYLLRGVDVTTVALGLFLLTTASIAAASTALAMGTFARFKPIAPLMTGLGGLMFAWIGLASIPSAAGIIEITQELDPGDLWRMITAWSLGFAQAVTLNCMIATAMLSHPFENRSSGFRIFCVLSSLTWFAWVALAIETRHLDEALPFTALFLAFGLLPIVLMAVTEDDRFSPRMRALVPKRRGLMWLVMPWLPGASNATIFAMGWLALLGAGGFLLPRLLGARFDSDQYTVGFGLAYVVLAILIARVLRLYTRSGAVGNWIARIGTIIFFAAGMILPLLADLLIKERVRDWHPGHLLNPFWTYEHFDSPRSGLVEPMSYVLIVCGILLIVSVPSCVRTYKGLRALAKQERERIDA